MDSHLRGDPRITLNLSKTEHKPSHPLNKLFLLSELLPQWCCHITESRHLCPPSRLAPWLPGSLARLPRDFFSLRSISSLPFAFIQVFVLFLTLPPGSTAKTPIFIFFFFFFFPFLFRAIPAAHGSSQGRGQIGASAANLHHSHSNTGSKPHLLLRLQLAAAPILN